MAYPQQRINGWGQFVNPEYNRLQSQIEQQTQALLRERQQFSGVSNGGGNSFIVEQPYLRPVESQKYLKLNTDRSHSNNAQNAVNYINQPQSSINPRSQMSDKVRQLMELCKKDNSQFSNELMRVLGEQKNVYNELLSNGQSSQKTQYFGVNPIIQAQKESSVNLNPRNEYQQQHLNNLSNSSSGNHTPQRGGSSNFVNINPQNIENSIARQNQNQNQATLGKGNNVFRQAIQSANSKLQLGEDLIQMIEQIERKALNEIEKLREQKIDLMKQLKQQIQGNNQLQKQLNTLSQNQQSLNQTKQLQNQQGCNANINRNNSQMQLQEEILKQIKFEMDNLRKENQSLRDFNNRQQHERQFSQVSTGQGYQNVNANQVSILRQRVSILEGELRSRDQLIKQLSLQVTRLNQQGGSTSSYQIASLLQQGQAIRQQTLQFIRLKQGQSQGYNQQQGSYPFNDVQRIRELQQLLEREEQQKQNFLNDLLAFKQKYQQLQEENRALKRQSNIGNSNIAKFSPIYDKSSVGQGVGNSIDDYERILSQMRGAARY